MSRSRLPFAIAIGIAVLAIGGFLTFQQFLAGDSVPALSLAPTAPDASATTEPGVSPTADQGTSAPVEATPAGVAGTWTVGDGSVVGYRVREQLGGVTALTDAVGRTSAITGSATIEPDGAGVRVTAASFEADLTQLTSDDGRRDNRIRSIGAETNRFPTASFILTGTVSVGAEALAGATVDVALPGDLTIHGVTKSVTIQGQARLNGDRIEIVAALTFPFSDFGMTPPSIAGFVQVQDDATLEVLVSLARSGS